MLLSSAPFFCSLLAAIPATVQTPGAVLPIPSRVTCTRCEIRLTQIVVLGDTAGPGELPREPRNVVVDERGRYVVSFYADHLPMVFDARGRFVSRIGGLGAGPGEFKIALLAETARDTAWMVDTYNARVSAMRFDGSDWVLAGSWSRPGMPIVPASIIRLANGSILFNGTIATADRIGYPLHRLGPDGTITSFGTDRPSLRPSQPGLGIRYLWPSGDGGAWVSHLTRYEIERYNGLGTRLGWWSRDAAWFPPHDGSQRLNPDVPPVAQAFAIAEDAAGLVWTFVAVPDARFKEAFGPSPGPGRIDLRSVSRLYDTMIEVLDLRRGVVVASTKVDHAIFLVAGRQGRSLHVLSDWRTEFGGWQLPVFRLELIGAIPSDPESDLH